MRKGVATVLAGGVGAQVSLAHNRRLRAVLSEEGGSARDRLLQELPAAVMHEWATPPGGVSVSTSGKRLVWATPPSGYSPLLRRVAHLLESGGSEQGRLERVGKLAGEPPDVAGTEDEDLAEFERQETLRQDLARLRGWVQNAGFSTNEVRVFELDIETNFNTSNISQELGKSPSTVRQWRKRYQDKIRKAAGL